jgi:hypothetical protein
MKKVAESDGYEMRTRMTRTVTRPAVIHSAWRASDGSVGIVVGLEDGRMG